jgi:hypothetical protein
MSKKDQHGNGDGNPARVVEMEKKLITPDESCFCEAFFRSSAAEFVDIYRHSEVSQIRFNAKA